MFPEAEKKHHENCCSEINGNHLNQTLPLFLRCFGVRFRSFSGEGYVFARKQRLPDKHKFDQGCWHHLCINSCSCLLHPGRLTWNLQITHLERKMIFQTSMIMFHVNLQGCMYTSHLHHVYTVQREKLPYTN